jgi:hypothetical protein
MEVASGALRTRRPGAPQASAAETPQGADPGRPILTWNGRSGGRTASVEASLRAWIGAWPRIGGLCGRRVQGPRHAGARRPGPCKAGADGPSGTGGWPPVARVGKRGRQDAAGGRRRGERSAWIRAFEPSGGCRAPHRAASKRTLRDEGPTRRPRHRRRRGGGSGAPQGATASAVGGIRSMPRMRTGVASI